MPAIWQHTVKFCSIQGFHREIKIPIQGSCPWGLVSIHLSLSLWLSQTIHSKTRGVPKSLKGCRKPYRVFGMGVQNLLGNMKWECQNYGGAKLPVTPGRLHSNADGLLRQSWPEGSGMQPDLEADCFAAKRSVGIPQQAAMPPSSAQRPEFME